MSALSDKRAARKIELVDPDTLTLDYTIYPRAKESNEHIRELIHAMEMDAALPPLIVRESTGQIIDGFHRWHAHVRHYRGEGVPILAEYREYPSNAEAFKEALSLNAAHGLRLRSVDREWALDRARALGMTPEMVAVAVKLPIHRLTKRRTNSAVKGFAGTSAAQREKWALADHKHNEAVEQALRDLAHNMVAEWGASKVPELLQRVSRAKKDGEGLRAALLDAAAAFVWWVARTPPDAPRTKEAEKDG